MVYQQPPCYIWNVRSNWVWCDLCLLLKKFFVQFIILYSKQHLPLISAFKNPFQKRGMLRFEPGAGEWKVPIWFAAPLLLPRLHFIGGEAKKSCYSVIWLKARSSGLKVRYLGHFLNVFLNIFSNNLIHKSFYGHNPFFKLESRWSFQPLLKLL